MNKAIMISVKPEYVAKILNGEKTIEIRKTMPKCDLPCEVYIYCTNTGRPLAYGQENACVEAHYTQTNGISRDGAEKIWDVLNGKVVAKFTLNKIEEYELNSEYAFNLNTVLNKSCLNLQEIRDYSKDKNVYAWQIDDLQVFDEPKELKDFYIRCKCYDTGCNDSSCPLYQVLSYEYKEYEFDCEGNKPIQKAPQSWCYVEEENE